MSGPFDTALQIIIIIITITPILHIMSIRKNRIWAYFLCGTGLRTFKWERDAKNDEMKSKCFFPVAAVVLDELGRTAAVECHATHIIIIIVIVILSFFLEQCIMKGYDILQFPLFNVQNLKSLD